VLQWYFVENMPCKLSVDLHEAKGRSGCKDARDVEAIASLTLLRQT
jgi:hypothetical protein